MEFCLKKYRPNHFGGRIRCESTIFAMYKITNIVNKEQCKNYHLIPILPKETSNRNNMNQKKALQCVRISKENLNMWPLDSWHWKQKLLTCFVENFNFLHNMRLNFSAEGFSSQNTKKIYHMAINFARIERKTITIYTLYVTNSFSSCS